MTILTGGRISKMKPSLNYKSRLQKLRPCAAALKQVVAAVENTANLQAFYIVTCDQAEAETETHRLALQMGAHRYPIWVGGHSVAISTADKHNGCVKRWLSRSDQTYLTTSGLVVLDAATLFASDTV